MNLVCLAGKSERKEARRGSSMLHGDGERGHGVSVRIHSLVLINAKEWLESESDGPQQSDTLSCVALFFFHQSPP